MYIRPDLTKTQAERCKNLKDEWKVKVKDRYMIRRGRVVPQDENKRNWIVPEAPTNDGVSGRLQLDREINFPTLYKTGVGVKSAILPTSFYKKHKKKCN